ncbi:MarR family winged helix-turn-helix transcriptional regulator [Rhodococcus sp. IEGM1428]|uniref:MarR family winged helix-turn-helix transcriptional regulator n=1 Tax=Rhodococcus sp. IEGM1428 TaxID=3392191 RepID=UPI003D111FA0
MDATSVVRFDDAPGHLLRRAQQIHTDLWSKEVGDVLTGPQYATLVAIAGWENLDQKKAGELASLDKSTVGGVVKRLESKGWVTRATSPLDARRRILLLTDYARRELPSISSAAERVQRSLLRPLTSDDAHKLVTLLHAVAFAFEDEKSIGTARFTAGPMLELDTTPGYLIRRAQQVHAALWTSVFAGDLTSPQYAVLAVAAVAERVDQSQIGNRASLDSSSVADIVTRLEARGWLTRRKDDVDGRRMIVELTLPATTAIRHLTTSVRDVQQRLLSPLSDKDASVFMTLMQRVVNVDCASDGLVTTA